MRYFFCKLIPPRPDFANSMSEEEAKLMRAHAAYWQELMSRGLVVAFGPVADPNGAFGIGIFELADDTDPADLAQSDPAIRADVGFGFELYPMPRLIKRVR